MGFPFLYNWHWPPRHRELILLYLIVESGEVLLSPQPRNLLGIGVRLVGLFLKDSLVRRRGLVGDEEGTCW